MIAALNPGDLDEIMAFEAEAFSPQMQASAETYRQRFALGHVMLGERAERLQGLIAFSYGAFDPAHPETLPTDFKTWSTQPVPADYDTVFVYNLGLLPGVRGTRVIRDLITAAMRRAIADGCRQAVGEGPIPSYAGNGHIHANPDIRAALDAYAAGGPAPDETLLFHDPHLALYRGICPCRVVRVMPDFLPADAASGGFRAMLFRDLRDFPPAPDGAVA